MHTPKIIRLHYQQKILNVIYVSIHYIYRICIVRVRKYVVKRTRAKNHCVHPKDYQTIH